MSRWIAGFFYLVGMFAAASAQAGVVVVLNSGDASVSLIDQATRKEIRRFEVGKEPHHLMATPDGQTLIVANAAGNDLVYLNPATGEFQRRVRDIPDPYQIGFSPDRKWFVVAGNRLDRIDLYAANGSEQKFVKSVRAPKTPSHIAFSADSQFAFVTLQDSDELVALKLADQSVLWKIKVGAMPAGVWMTPDDRHLLVGMTGPTTSRSSTGGPRRASSASRRARVPIHFRPGATAGIFSFRTGGQYDQCHRPGHARTPLRHSGTWRPGLHGSDGRWQVPLGHPTLDQAGLVVDLAQRAVVDKVAVGRSPHGIFFVNSAPWK